MYSKFKESYRKNKEFRKKIQKIRKPETDSDSDSDSHLDSDIKFLVTEINKIDISDNIPIINTMPEVNYSEVRLFLDIIPQYSGEPCELNNFISACDEVTAQYADNQNVTKLVFRAIIGKLKGKALIIISSRVELTTWQEVKTILKSAFSDQRSFTCLLQELHHIKPTQKENSYSFGIRCQYLRSLIFSSINNDQLLSQPEKFAQINNIEKLILIQFQKYLSSQIQLAVRLKQPRTLEEALQYVLEEENFISLFQENKKYSINSNSNYSLPSTSKVTYVNNTQPIPRPSFQAPFVSQYNNQNQQRNFPSQPINVTPKQLPPQKYYTNQQVFGKPVNVFKPKGTPQPKPTPMSGITRQTVKPNLPTYRPNFFQAQSRPTFISEELHTIDNSEDEYAINEELQEVQITEIPDSENNEIQEIPNDVLEDILEMEEENPNFQEMAFNSNPS